MQVYKSGYRIVQSTYFLAFVTRDTNTFILTIRNEFGEECQRILLSNDTLKLPSKGYISDSFDREKMGLSNFYHMSDYSFTHDLIALQSYSSSYFTIIPTERNKAFEGLTVEKYAYTSVHINYDGDIWLIGGSMFNANQPVPFNYEYVGTRILNWR